MQPDPTDYIDFAALRRHVSNYENLFQKLLQLFLEQAPIWRASLDEAFASQDPTQIRQVCHRIKGGAGTLQAQPILDAVTELSQHATAGDMAAAAVSRSQLEGMINATVAFVQASGQLKT